MRVALVNPNRIKPPISPLGLEYVGEGLLAAGHEVNILDLCWEEQPEKAIPAFFNGQEYGLVGISIRNTDDCSFATRESFLPGFSSIVETIRKHSGAPIVAGGVGFSVMPEAVMAITGVDAGVVGDGEFTLTGIADRCQRQASWEDLPNLVLHRKGFFRRNPVSTVPLSRIPPMSRTLVDNRRYYLEGGQAGIETKRGCPMGCVYCADPLAKGSSTRLRPPEDVVAELGRLLGQGIEHVHICDSEFNVPEDHALEICGEIIRRGLGDRLHWYAYCKPGPFSRELAGQMRRSGCRGINFGADSGDEGMLGRLGRDFGPEEILSAARSCRENGIAVMFDLLLGAPGETRESIARTVERMMEIRCRPHRRHGRGQGLSRHPAGEGGPKGRSPERACRGKRPPASCFFPGTGDRAYRLRSARFARRQRPPVPVLRSRSPGSKLQLQRQPGPRPRDPRRVSGCLLGYSPKGPR